MIIQANSKQVHSKRCKKTYKSDWEKQENPQETA